MRAFGIAISIGLTFVLLSLNREFPFSCIYLIYLILLRLHILDSDNCIFSDYQYITNTDDVIGSIWLNVHR